MSSVGLNLSVAQPKKLGKVDMEILGVSLVFSFFFFKFILLLLCPSELSYVFACLFQTVLIKNNCLVDIEKK